MKKVIHFSKLFIPFIILSCVVIFSGVIRWVTTGINFGIDFQAGFIEKVKIAPPALTLSYSGAKTVTFTQTASQITIAESSIVADTQAYAFPYDTYKTLGDFVDALASIENLSASLKAPRDTPLAQVFVGAESNRIGQTPLILHFLPQNHANLTADDVRKAVASIPSLSVQQVGSLEEQYFQLRLADDGSKENAGETLRTTINDVLVKAYGADNIVVMSTDFVGSQFSATLAWQAIFLVLGALVLIFLYVTVRFQWNFALGAVLALIHDSLIMITFIVWSQIEFTSTTIAAILTIIGYSINDTVVVYDRIRENIRLNPRVHMVDVLNISQTEVLGRTIITTVTTMLAVLMLFIFTTGGMRDFAAALLVGMVSGVYSTIYIASAFIAFTGKNKTGDEIIRSKRTTSQFAEVTI